MNLIRKYLKELKESSLCAFVLTKYLANVNIIKSDYAVAFVKRVYKEVFYGHKGREYKAGDL